MVSIAEDKSIFIYVILLVLITSCKNAPSSLPKQNLPSQPVLPTRQDNPRDYPSDWEEVSSIDGVILDLRYATTQNFTGKVIYNCPRCFLRPEVASSIKRLQNDISVRYGWSLKLFDCYRPLPAQQKLWDIVPNPNYVTPPNKGSMHNRGLAVDLTIVDKSGAEIDMGTPFDYFGPEAHYDYTNHSPKVLRNRKVLRKLMELHGFSGIRTEWWHFSDTSKSYSISDWEWNCN